MKSAVVVLSVFLSASASAQPIELSGTIGAVPVFMDLSRDGDTASGWYLYLRVGKEIRLSGKLDHKGFFQLDEFTANTNTRTGSFAGRAVNGHWSGTWRNAAGKKPLAVALDEVHDRLAAVSGRFKCTAKHRDREYGFTYTHSIDLKLAKGRVKALTLARRETSEEGDDQSCRIGLADLRQLRSSTGILLRARADGTNSQQHCTIRILTAGDYLVIKTGNASQDGDDCKGAGSTMFCSPRSFWADLIVNRKKQVCRAVR